MSLVSKLKSKRQIKKLHKSRIADNNGKPVDPKTWDPFPPAQKHLTPDLSQPVDVEIAPEGTPSRNLSKIQEKNERLLGKKQLTIEYEYNEDGTLSAGAIEAMALVNRGIIPDEHEGGLKITYEKDDPVE